jgi:hypothetical protein
MFRATMCPSSGELLYHCDTWFMSPCVDDRLVCWSICCCIMSILYIYRATMCPSSGELLYQCDTWFMSLCVVGRLVRWSRCCCIISILYMFQATMFPSSGELTLSMRYLLYVNLDVCLVCTCTPDRRPHTVTYTSYRTDTVNSPDDGHIVVRNMYRIEINLDEKVVRQVGLFTKITLTLIRVCK